VLELPSVTLCGVDTRTPGLALRALVHSMRDIRFGDVVLFTHGDLGHLSSPGIRLVDIGAISTMSQYSEFMLRGLAPLIHTSHALVTQWDGFVVNASAWSGEFLRYDYIGAPWPHVPQPEAVGNGGFSLRSARLLRAMLDSDMIISHPEDLCICRTNRARLEQQHQIRFAPYELASAFAYERIVPAGKTFGFHGTNHLAEVLDADEVMQVVREMTTDMAFGSGARKLIRSLVYRGQFSAAEILLKRRLAAGDRRWPVLSLWLRMWLRRSLGLGRHAHRQPSE
jgi:hypothetical protein